MSFVRSSDVDPRRVVSMLALLAGSATAIATAQSPPRASDARIVRISHAAPFQGRRERALPGKPEGLCAGDFDGDGKLDLAASLVTPGALLIWSATNEGLLQAFESRPCGDFPLAPVALPRGSFGAIPSAQAIAVVSRAARTLEIVSAAGRRSSLERTPRAVAGGRIDGMAVLAIACDGRRLEVLRDGSAELELWTLSDDLPRCALVSGALSAVLVGFQDSTAVEAYSSGSAAPIGRLELGGIPRALAELDVDGDGERELVVAGGDHELWVFGVGRSGGASIWFDRHEPRSWPADAIPTTLAVADFDVDGRADLAVLNDFSLSLQVLSQLSAA
ncbi:MAG: VCBS repeat-containing protein, partial [Planctomycetota bacterium]